jgi:hypothetical protein
VIVALASSDARSSWAEQRICSEIPWIDGAGLKPKFRPKPKPKPSSSSDGAQRFSDRWRWLCRSRAAPSLRRGRASLKINYDLQLTDMQVEEHAV